MSACETGRRERGMRKKNQETQPKRRLKVSELSLASRRNGICIIVGAVGREQQDRPVGMQQAGGHAIGWWACNRPVGMQQSGGHATGRWACNRPVGRQQAGGQKIVGAWAGGCVCLRLVHLPSCICTSTC